MFIISKTALHVACENNQAKIVKQLLFIPSIDINSIVEVL